MATTIGPTAYLPLTVGGALLGDISVPLEVKQDESSGDVTVNLPASAKEDVAKALFGVANRLAPGLERPQRWVTGMAQTSVDQGEEGKPLEWPTTAGSAVLAKRGNGLGPQVLILQQTGLGSLGWWGAFTTFAGSPGRAGDWAWSSQEAVVENRYDLLQVLYVAPAR